MYVKLYATVWGVLLIVAAGLAVTGNFGMMTAIVYGFIGFGMVFMGMMSVLPSLVSTREGRELLCESNRKQSRPIPAAKTPSELHDWFFPTGIEMSRPKHH